MNPRLFLKVMILLMLFPSLICLFLPDTIASGYTKIMFPSILLISGIFSMRMASMYKKELRKAFIFLSFFLFFMIVPHIDFFRVVYSTFPLLVVCIQWITYAMLVLCAFYILKVTEVWEIGRNGWVIIVAALVIGIIIVAYHIPPVLHYYPKAYKIPLMLIYFLDVAIVIMLMPVVLLYRRQMRLEKRESITFTTITCGIILSLTGAYGYAIAFDVPMPEVPSHTGSVLDALYLFSYLIIAVGLYVHTKYDEWGLRMIEEALAGG